MSETTLARPEAVKAIVIMGGVPAVEGGYKDTHFGLDPKAVQLVLNSRANITLAPAGADRQPARPRMKKGAPRRTNPPASIGSAGY